MAAGTCLQRRPYLRYLPYYPKGTDKSFRWFTATRPALSVKSYLSLEKVRPPIAKQDAAFALKSRGMVDPPPLFLEYDEQWTSVQYV